VRAAARALGLRCVARASRASGAAGLLSALEGVDDADIVELQTHVDADARRVLLRGVDAVLANSRHEPFGLVGLETMAAGGLACIGGTGEDYAVPGRNALVLETEEPEEFKRLFEWLRGRPEHSRAMRRAGRATARQFAWPDVVERVLLPRVELATQPA
jgi:glycosyltransferase involved in cell wall biosynthesis